MLPRQEKRARFFMPIDVHYEFIPEGSTVKKEM
jgi:hypothetical protein